MYNKLQTLNIKNSTDVFQKEFHMCLRLYRKAFNLGKLKRRNCVSLKTLQISEPLSR